MSKYWPVGLTWQWTEDYEEFLSTIRNERVDIIFTYVANDRMYLTPGADIHTTVKEVETLADLNSVLYNATAQRFFLQTRFGIYLPGDIRHMTTYALVPQRMSAHSQVSPEITISPVSQSLCLWYISPTQRGRTDLWGGCHIRFHIEIQLDERKIQRSFGLNPYRLPSISSIELEDRYIKGFPRESNALSTLINGKTWILSKSKRTESPLVVKRKLELAGRSFISKKPKVARGRKSRWRSG